eukprot:gb/GEZN01003865.1/.p1 GENE.gb/GEZN01003865.1/~~gb/GEZN01003865.1/.p1  ORF type:complete len:554 (+),score=76.26 gb/GEZN01003865.1/:170-1831(+)
MLTGFKFFVITFPFVLGIGLFVFRRLGFNQPFEDDPLIAEILLDLSSVVQILLGIFGMHSFYLLWHHLKGTQMDTISPPVVLTMEVWGPRQSWPKVCVQLPIFNEIYVIENLIRCCVAIDYPPDKLEIQVLDDSNDADKDGGGGTKALVAKVLKELGATTTVKLSHHHREDRSGFKAGALAIATQKTDAEFIAIFDADFLPNPDFLVKVLPYFKDGDNVGCVQTRWGHSNYGHSMLTKLQAIGHDGHFIIEQYAKHRSGALFNFNGTGGIWRKQTIKEAGGWQSDTLAEDLDLSYRAQLAGWRFHYLRDVVVPAELPPSITAFKKQQARWARGSMQTALKVVQKLWNSDRVSLGQKIAGTIHLFGYGVHPLMFLNLMLTIALFFIAPARSTEYLTLVVMVLAVGPPMVVATAQLYIENQEGLMIMPLLLMLHHGLTVNNTFAVFQAFKHTKGIFERTPKFGEMGDGNKWRATEYFKHMKANLPTYEIAVIILLCSVMAYANTHKLQVNKASYPWLVFFVLGYSYIVYLHFQEMFSFPSAPSIEEEKKEQKKTK